MKKPFLQSESTTFTKIFPQVKSLKLRGQEHGDFSSFSVISSKSKGSIYYTESSIPFIITCSNPRCQQGGYKLQWILDSIIKSKEKKYKNSFHCNGHEGTPKGRHIGDSCCNHIEIEIDIDYESVSGTKKE